MRGRVLASSYGVYQVLSNENHVTYTLHPKGLFRHQKEQVFVGDDVEFSAEDSVINYIYPRKNVLKRPLISNIDQLMIVTSIKEPDFSLFLIYKFLTYANMNDIPAIVVVTKTDLLDSFENLFHIKEELSKNNVKMIFHSFNENNDEIQSILKNKITCLMGQTGVGKSSLLNSLDVTYSRAIGDYSLALGRGKHKTKEVILLPFGNDGFIADTPGFSSLVLDMYKEDLALYFPGFKSYALQCKYTNCLHMKESECMVQKAIEEGKLSKECYDIYVLLNNELDYKMRRFNK